MYCTSNFFPKNIECERCEVYDLHVYHRFLARVLAISSKGEYPSIFTKISYITGHLSILQWPRDN
jgi:hypothetical protein